MSELFAPDYRALCAELLAALKSWSPSGGGPLEGKEAETEARLINRVSTLLAQPEPEGPMPQPAAGEVAELVEWLREASSVAVRDGWPNEQSINLTRTADLLERLAPQPVPVAERPWEREGWCDEHGYCWWFDCGDIGWVYDSPETCQHWASWVLPFHALPLPTSGEGEK